MGKYRTGRKGQVGWGLNGLKMTRYRVIQDGEERTRGMGIKRSKNDKVDRVVQDGKERAEENGSKILINTLKHLN